LQENYLNKTCKQLTPLAVLVDSLLSSSKYRFTAFAWPAASIAPPMTFINLEPRPGLVPDVFFCS
jgi:hypothetical protein